MPSLAFTLLNRLPELERVATLVQTFGTGAGLPEDAIYKMNLALEEILTNIIHYGFDDGAVHEIAILLTLDGHQWSAAVSDDGKPFDPHQAPAPDLDAPLEDRPIGGLGLFLVMRMMDQVRYSRSGNRNRIDLIKTIASPAP